MDVLIFLQYVYNIDDRGARFLHYFYNVDGRGGRFLHYVYSVDGRGAIVYIMFIM